MVRYSHGDNNKTQAPAGTASRGKSPITGEGTVRARIVKNPKVQKSRTKTGTLEPAAEYTQIDRS